MAIVREELYEPLNHSDGTLGDGSNGGGACSQGDETAHTIFTELILPTRLRSQLPRHNSYLVYTFLRMWKMPNFAYTLRVETKIPQKNLTKS